MKEELTQERLKDLLDYDPETGVFTWKVSRRGRGTAAGRVAGKRHCEGYVSIGIDGRQYLAHRLAILYTDGAFPSQDTDHMNGDRSDNRRENLREASRSQNNMNSKLRSTNKTGIRGVYESKRGRFISRVNFDGVCISLGSFSCPREAAHAYNKAAVQIYGEFAVLNPI